MSTPRGTWALRDRPGVVWLALAVLLAWGVVGLVLCVTTFKWFKRGTT